MSTRIYLVTDRDTQARRLIRAGTQAQATRHAAQSRFDIEVADVEANIASEYFFTAEEGAQGALANSDPELGAEFPQLQLLTFCVLVLRNGFTVTGESACASPENFDAQIGRTIARKNAVEKIWPLMGYELKSKLSENV